MAKQLLTWFAVYLLTVSFAQARERPEIPLGFPEPDIFLENETGLKDRIGDIRRAHQKAVWIRNPETEAELRSVFEATDARVAQEYGANSLRMAAFLAATATYKQRFDGWRAAVDRAWHAAVLERHHSARHIVYETYLNYLLFSGQASRDDVPFFFLTTTHRRALLDFIYDLAVSADKDDRLLLMRQAFEAAQLQIEGEGSRVFAAKRRPSDARELLGNVRAYYKRANKMQFWFRRSNIPEWMEEDAERARIAHDRAVGIAEQSLEEFRETGLDPAKLLFAHPVPLSTVQSALSPDEAIVLIAGAATGYMVFVANDQKLGIFQVARDAVDIVDDGKALVAAFNPESARGGATLRATQPKITLDAEWRSAAHRLYLDFFADGQTLLDGKEKIYVVGTGTMPSIPFEVLLTEPDVNTSTSMKDWPWLVRSHAFQILPSVEALLDDAPQTREPAYIGFGAPDYAIGIGTWAEYADNYSVRRLTPLPEAAGEVERVGQLFPKDRSSVFTADKASEEHLWALNASAELKDATVLHFATHGIAIPGPQNTFAGSTLALTAILEEPERDRYDLEQAFMPSPDGALTREEIRQLDLAADLVILSACHSASGIGVLGNESIGLTGPFLSAGARRVLGTYWPVNSDAAVEIVTSMMEEDPALHDPARALRHALITTIDKGGYRADPAYWGAFTLIGAR